MSSVHSSNHMYSTSGQSSPCLLSPFDNARVIAGHRWLYGTFPPSVIFTPASTFIIVLPWRRCVLLCAGSLQVMYGLCRLSGLNIGSPKHLEGTPDLMETKCHWLSLPNSHLQTQSMNTLDKAERWLAILLEPPMFMLQWVLPLPSLLCSSSPQVYLHITFSSFPCHSSCLALLFRALALASAIPQCTDARHLEHSLKMKPLCLDQVGQDEFTLRRHFSVKIS